MSEGPRISAVDGLGGDSLPFILRSKTRHNSLTQKNTPKMVANLVFRWSGIFMTYGRYCGQKLQNQHCNDIHSQYYSI